MREEKAEKHKQQARGVFITIEGGEGVGKSTNIESIREYLQQKNVESVVTREPGGTLIAEKVRKLLLDVHEEQLTELSELLLVFAARAQHIESLILPALADGKWVICDRFTDATYAYQGGGRGLDRTKIAQLETMVQGQLKPNLTIILDMDPALGMERAAKRGSLDRFEQEALEFFDKVRACYLEIAAREPERCVIVDASQKLVDVKASLFRMLDDRLPQLKL